MIKYTPQLPSGQAYSELAFFDFIAEANKNTIINDIKEKLKKNDAMLEKKVKDFNEANIKLKEVHNEFRSFYADVIKAIRDIKETLKGINNLKVKWRIKREEKLETQKAKLLGNIEAYPEEKYKNAYSEILRTKNEVSNHIINITAFVDCFIKHKKDILEGKDFYCNDPQNSPVAKAYNKCPLVEQEAIKEFFIGENGKYKALRKSEVMEFFNKHINVKVCLYCNINYTYAVEEKGESGENKKIFLYELDHFYPKSEYPWLALSLWNLIPSCHTCNSSYKGKIILKTHPYQEKISERFSFIPTQTNAYVFFSKEDDIKLVLKGGNPKEKEGKSKEKDNISALGLEERYNQHKDVVIDLYKKSQMYPPEKIEELYKLHKPLFSGETEVRNLVFSCVPEEEFHNHSLAKFRFDIAKELGLI